MATPDSLTPQDLRRKWLAASLALCLGTAVAYAGVLDSPFNYDDGLVVLHNPSIQTLDTYLWSTNIQYRHLFYLTFALNYHLGGEDPFGYHLFNLGVHLCVSLLVLALTFLTVDRGTPWGRAAAWRIACLAAFLFAFNPIQTEAVSYISGRASSLMALFYLASLLCFVRGTLRETPWPATVCWYSLCLVSGVAAILTKETAATFPLALFLYDLCFMRNERFKPFRWRLACVYLPVPAGILGLILVSPAIQHQVIHWLGRFNVGYGLQQVLVVPFAAKLVLFPINQVFDYEWPYATLSTDTLRVITSLAAVGGLAGTWLWLLKRFPPAAFGLAWYLLVIGPSNSFLPRMDLLSERNLYLPSYGLLFLLAVWVDRLGWAGDARARRQRLLALARGVLVLCLLVLLVHRNQVYASNITLWEDALEKNPGKPRIYHNLSHFYTREKQYDRAFIMLKKLAASRAKPYYRAYAYTNLGNIYTLWGDQANAEIAFRRAEKIYPEFPIVHFNMGVLYATKGMPEEAVAAFDRARRYQAVYEGRNLLPPELALYRARVLYELHRLKEAETEIKNYLASNPDHPEGRLLLAHILQESGRENEALSLYETVRNPPLARAEAQTALAHIYLQRGENTRALASLQRAVEAEPGRPSRRFELGRLLWEQRRNAEAAQHLKAALKLNPPPQMVMAIEHYLTRIEEQAGS